MKIKMVTWTKYFTTLACLLKETSIWHISWQTLAKPPPPHKAEKNASQEEREKVETGRERKIFAHIFSPWRKAEQADPVDLSLEGIDKSLTSLFYLLYPTCISIFYNLNSSSHVDISFAYTKNDDNSFSCQCTRLTIYCYYIFCIILETLFIIAGNWWRH